MMKLRTFLQDNIAALLCTALLAVMSIIAWRLLTPSPDRQLTPTYALADTALPPLHDFRADALVWQPYDYPAPPPLPTDTAAVYLSWEIPHT
ncbi:MAG: GGDEF domain-containing protein, partial [Selenomonas sp.]|nr:GGDEF domain-containing protein [Selenomonas sp.]